MAECKSCGNYVAKENQICNKCYQSDGDCDDPISSHTKNNTTVSCEWLLQNLNNKHLILLDASPKNNKSGLTSDVSNKHIPNSRYFDLVNDFSDTTAEFPNTFPSTEQFNANCQKLGINQDSIIVVYDNLGIYTSPRVWWMFQTMGHQDVYVLDGGLPEWIRNQYATVDFLSESSGLGNFKGVKNTYNIKSFEFIQTFGLDASIHLVDARSKGRFEGTTPEPREGLKSGAIPYSTNIPFQEVLDGGKLKSKQQLAAIFKDVINRDHPIVFSCGSGLTACVLLLAAKHIDIDDVAIYDGSWTEWATKNNLTN